MGALMYVKFFVFYHNVRKFSVFFTLFQRKKTRLKPHGGFEIIDDPLLSDAEASKLFFCENIQVSIIARFLRDNSLIHI